MKVYVASTLSNADEARAVSEALALDGWETTYKWFEHGSVQADGPDRIAEVARAEIAGVLEADLVVAVLPGGRGTHVEIGIALGIMAVRDHITDFGNNGPNRILIYGRDEVICAFYMVPGVMLVDKGRGIDGLRLEALRAWREIGGGS